VVRLYIRDLLATVARPVMELKGFQRFHLLASQEKELVFTIEPSILAMLGENQQKRVEPGGFRIMICASLRDIRLKETLTVVSQ
jgi:beta-glucosidase